jgi:Alcohol dehydrogenase GroES-like domain
MSLLHAPTVPAKFTGIGYTKSRDGFPLEAVHVPVPRPAVGQVLIRVACSSLNPLQYKLAELNFFGRTHPVILGLDLSGIIVAQRDQVKDFAVGDEVMVMAAFNGDGGWADGGRDGYALARAFLTIEKTPRSPGSPALRASIWFLIPLTAKQVSSTPQRHCAKVERGSFSASALARRPARSTLIAQATPSSWSEAQVVAQLMFGIVAKTRFHPEALKERYP